MTAVPAADTEDLAAAWLGRTGMIEPRPADEQVRVSAKVRADLRGLCRRATGGVTPEAVRANAGAVGNLDSEPSRVLRGTAAGAGHRQRSDKSRSYGRALGYCPYIPCWLAPECWA